MRRVSCRARRVLSSAPFLRGAPGAGHGAETVTVTLNPASIGLAAVTAGEGETRAERRDRLRSQGRLGRASERPLWGGAGAGSRRMAPGPAGAEGAAEIAQGRHYWTCSYYGVGVEAEPPTANGDRPLLEMRQLGPPRLSYGRTERRQVRGGQIKLVPHANMQPAEVQCRLPLCDQTGSGTGGVRGPCLTVAVGGPVIRRAGMSDLRYARISAAGYFVLVLRHLDGLWLSIRGSVRALVTAAPLQSG